MVVPAWSGHLNPMTTLGRELNARGHAITILSFPESRERVQKAGLQFEILDEKTFPDGEWERRTRELSVLSGFAAARYTIGWLGDMTKIMLESLPVVLAHEKFDGLVMDQVCYGAETGAEAEGTPVVVACNALPVHLQPDVPVHSETWAYSTSRFSRMRNRLVQHLIVSVAKRFLNPIRLTRVARGHSWNVWNYLNEIPGSLAHVAQLPACLDFPRQHAPDHFHHTGPWHENQHANQAGFDWDWLDERPLLYASLGTLQNGQDHLYQLILDACAELPLQVVLTLGRDYGKRPDRIPTNAQVLGYGPQLALLQRASIVITHAGLNTTLESLTQGLPMVALPIANEQPGIAARIKHAGVGEWLRIRGLSAAKLRCTILSVHGNDTYRKRAQCCAQTIKEEKGLQRAAAIIEEAFVERRRVTCNSDRLR
ncbi:MAG: glycosyl transferase family 1 [Verrucomicrobiales bacterium]|nr:glycosyl transferase family 1 [Verrucomicrobiales bacterium]